MSGGSLQGTIDYLKHRRRGLLEIHGQRMEDPYSESTGARIGRAREVDALDERIAALEALKRSDDDREGKIR